jgi:hypothetical protein
MPAPQAHHESSSRPSPTWLLAFAGLAIGFLGGIVTARLFGEPSPSEQMKLPAATPTVSAASTAWVAPQEVTGKLGAGLERQFFRLCARIPEDDDAVNLYIWATDRLFLERAEYPFTKPTHVRKDVHRYVGFLNIEGDDVTFRVVPVNQKPAP